MADIYIHNTLSRQKEKFTPIDASNVRMYVCGPTVYDFAHLGNARPVVVFDTLYRLLKRHYPRVTYVRNITDVDDKIMAKAKESGEPIDSITKRTTEAYHQDMAALNALPPDIEPRATQHIAQMIAMIQTLIEKGNAYEARDKDGMHVLFYVPSMKDYGKLSRNSREELIDGARVEVAPNKKDPVDFVLWKPSAPDQPGWDSPWGRGRPGWHIECSAMAKEHLGTKFDIHGGGLDLIFPHHENEIAQSCCANDTDILARYWMHNGFLIVNGKKMSKSLGNFFTVRDLLAKAPGEALRLALLQVHYRQPLDFTEKRLLETRSVLDYWYRALRTDDLKSEEPENKEAMQAMEILLGNDLNTVDLIKFLNAMASAIILLLEKPDGTDALNALKKVQEAKLPVGISQEHAASLKSVIDEQIKLTYTLRIQYSISELRWLLKKGGDMIGVLQQDPEAWFRWKPEGTKGISEGEIDKLINTRLDARMRKDYKEADRIRDYLAEQGVILEDYGNNVDTYGTNWRRK